MRNVLEDKVVVQPMEEGFAFLKSGTSTTGTGCNDRTVTDFNNFRSADTSSRGAADMTAGRIYFSTPSAKVRIPVTELVSPPPSYFCSLITTSADSVLFFCGFRLAKSFLKCCGNLFSNIYPILLQLFRCYL